MLLRQLGSRHGAFLNPTTGVISPGGHVTLLIRDNRITINNFQPATSTSNNHHENNHEDNNNKNNTTPDHNDNNHHESVGVAGEEIGPKRRV